MGLYRRPFVERVVLEAVLLIGRTVLLLPLLAAVFALTALDPRWALLAGAVLPLCIEFLMRKREDLILLMLFFSPLFGVLAFLWVVSWSLVWAMLPWWLLGGLVWWVGYRLVLWKVPVLWRGLAPVFSLQDLTAFVEKEARVWRFNVAQEHGVARAAALSLKVRLTLDTMPFPERGGARLQWVASVDGNGLQDKLLFFDIAGLWAQRYGDFVYLDDSVTTHTHRWLFGPLSAHGMVDLFSASVQEGNDTLSKADALSPSLPDGG